MNEQEPAVAPQPRQHFGLATPGVDQAAALLHRRFHRFDGHLAARLWEGTLLKLGRAAHRAAAEPRYTLVCRSPGVVRLTMLGRGPLRMAEAYVHGEIDIKSDFFAAMALKDQLDSIRVSARDRLRIWFAALRPRTADADGQAHAAECAARP